MQRKKRRKALPRRSGKRAARRVAKPAASKQRRRKKKKARAKKRPVAKRRVTKRPAAKLRVTKRPAAKRKRAVKRSAKKQAKAKRPKAKAKPSTRRGSPSPRARKPKRPVTPKKRKALPKKRKALPKKRKALPKKRPKKRKKFLPLPPTGLLKEPTGVPLTERERGEVEIQRRLIREEIERLKKLRRVDETRGVFPSEEEIEDMREPEAELREFVEGSISDVIERDRTERQKRRARRLAMEAVAPQALRDMLKLAREQTYDHRPVTNVRVLRNGWIVGVDAWGRDLRAIALVNTVNNRVRIRWRDRAPLPKRGGYIEDPGYESLKPQRYAVFGVFA